LIWSLFGDKNGNRDFLYRQTGVGLSQPVLLYSQEPVVDHHGLWNVESKKFSLLDQLRVGDQVVWSIRVNPTIKTGNKRHDIVTRARRLEGDKARESGHGEPPSVEELAARLVPAWLRPRLKAAGVEPGDIHLESHVTKRFGHDLRAKHRHENPVTLATSDLRGTANVTDIDVLRAAAAKGIGHGKAYGCGMLLLRRAA
jgi:CRISPR system Cascade subunit CasE